MTRGRKPRSIRAGSSPIQSVPKPPAWLSKDGKAEWRHVAPILVERGVLTSADLGTLESYCASIGAIRQAQRIINAEGITIAGKRHAAFGIMNAAQTTARLNANELGLTPVSRSRPTIHEDVDADSLLDF